MTYSVPSRGRPDPLTIHYACNTCIISNTIDTCKHMDIIAVINQKGGTGKTTTTMNLGCALAALNRKVLLIDLDPQANLTYSFGIRPDRSMTEVMQAKQTIQAILVNKEGVAIAPASMELANVEISIVNKIGREGILKDRLKNVKGYDFVFIDCPPALSVLTVNALNSADEVLIPLQMEILSFQGLTQLLNTIKEVKQVLNHKLKIAGIIPSMFDNRRNLSNEVLEQLEGKVKEKVFKSVIRENVKIAESPSFAQSVISYAPDSHGAQDFIKLAKEFNERRY